MRLLNRYRPKNAERGCKKPTMAEIYRAQSGGGEKKRPPAVRRRKQQARKLWAAPNSPNYTKFIRQKEVIREYVLL
jgi:hypothetical protein